MHFRHQGNLIFYQKDLSSVGVLRVLFLQLQSSVHHKAAESLRLGHIVDKYMLKAKILPKKTKKGTVLTYRGVLRGCDRFQVSKCQLLLGEVCQINGCDLSC